MKSDVYNQILKILIFRSIIFLCLILYNITNLSKKKLLQMATFLYVCSYETYNDERDIIKKISEQDFSIVH